MVTASHFGMSKSSSSSVNAVASNARARRKSSSRGVDVVAKSSRGVGGRRRDGQNDDMLNAFLRPMMTDAEDAARRVVDDVVASTLRAIGGIATDTFGGGLAATAATSTMTTDAFPFPRGPKEDVALELAYDPLAFIERVTREHGDAVGLTLAREKVVLVSSPELARAVLADESDCFQKEGTAFFPGSSLAGNGLLVSDGETWARQRRLSNPAFRRAAVATYARCMIEVGEKLVKTEWSRRGERDAYADFNDATLEIVARALFGTDVVGSRANRINAAIKDAFEFFGRRAATGMVIPEWLPTFDNVRYNEAVKRLDDEVYAIIAKRRQAIKDGQSSGDADLLDRLLRATDEEDDASTPSGMTDKALRDELMTLMVAGQETSAILLSWACALIAEHPDVSNKIAAEVREVLSAKPPHSSLEASDFSKLQYTEAVILETLRIRPPAYMVGRCASKDVQLRDDLTIRKGTTVLIAPYIIQRDPKYWNEPTQFKPERWLVPSPFSAGTLARDALKNLGPNDAYFPFGGGPRVCIGTGFAMMESVLLLGLICESCEMRLPPMMSSPRPKALITLRPDEIKLVVGPRPRRN